MVDLHERNAALTAENAALRAEVAALQARVAELEARLSQDSTNSHRPPSSDGPAAVAERPERKPSGRKRGGQKGHRGRWRAMLPPDEVVAHTPAQAHCGCGAAWELAAEPRVLEEVELPPVAAHVIHHHYFTGRCPACGTHDDAGWRAQQARGVAGPRLVAFAALLVGRYHVTRRGLQSLFSELLGLRLSLGALSLNEGRLSRALAQPYEEIRAALRREPHVHADETGHRREGRRAWLWTLTAGALVLYRAAASRSAAVAHELLDGFAGITVSDRYGGYNWLPVERRAVCWAHLLRDFRALALREPEWAQWLVWRSENMFRYLASIRDRPPGDPRRARYLASLRRAFRRALDERAEGPAGPGRGFARRLRKLEPALWAFAADPAIPPTNNAAERALRPYVIHRKISLGTQSERGDRLLERLLSVIQSARGLGLEPFAYLTAALQAAHEGQPAPRLLPAP